MLSPPKTVADLRSLLAMRFPSRARTATCVFPMGIRGLDDALGGGLPTGRLTEIVSDGPGTGGQTIIAQMLSATRKARLRIALVDGGDGFAPEDVPADHLRHLVWVRGRSVNDMLSAADILVRDGNYAIVAIDTRGLAERALLRTPATTWHRLRHACEGGSVATVVCSTTGIVPAVPWRLRLHQTIPLSTRRLRRDEIASNLEAEVVRGHLDLEEERSA